MRRGRPKHGESRLAEYAERCSPRLRPLCLEAVRRGLSLEQFRRLVNVNIKVFKRYFDSRTPAFSTVTRMCAALNYGAMIARALCDELTERDCQEIAALEQGEIAIRRAKLFQNPTLVGLALSEALANMAKPVVSSAHAAFLLAFHGLQNATVPAHQHEYSLLGPGLDALENIIAPHGFSLTDLMVDEKALLERRDEALDWYLLLRDTAGLSADDEARIGRVLLPYIGSSTEAGPARRNRGELRPFALRTEIRQRARERARSAYRQAVLLEKPSVTVVFESPYMTEGAFPDVGVTLVRGVPMLVTTAQARMLLTNPHVKLIAPGEKPCERSK